MRIRYRYICLLLLSTLALTDACAQRYIARTGHIRFFSYSPIEDIEAHNREVSSIIDLSSGELVFSLPVKAFQFEKALMQEHFNEKYMESDKFPKAQFKGKITDISSLDLKRKGPHNAQVTGNLTVHGVTKPVTTSATLSLVGKDLSALATFIVKPADHDIEIPWIVRNNIAKEMEVTVEITYSPMAK